MKTFGAILLVAGTCIGSGMIALPMVLAKLGIIPSIILMLVVWFFMYFTSLINLELNLQAGQGLPLGKLGKRFSGPVAEFIGAFNLKLLSYSLLAVFIYGATSITQELIANKFGIEYSFNLIASVISLFAIGMLLLPIKIVDYFNRLLFMSLLSVVVVLLVGLAASLDWFNLPLKPVSADVKGPFFAGIIPVVFTSFGFQVIFHTLTDYCHKDSKVLKRAFFWGSLIPAIVYILWTCSILSVVYHKNPDFFGQMAFGQADVGELIKVLSAIAHWRTVQILVWLISLLAIFTSIIGVGVGLYQSVHMMLRSNHVLIQNHLTVALLTIAPAYLAVILIPNAFITILGFAGMILAIIAILLPVYLFRNLDKTQLHYPELRNKWLIIISQGFAIIVIGCELYNILSKAI